MNISQLKYNNKQNKIIFLTTNNSTPIKMKRFSFSNSQTSNQFKTKCRNKNKIKEAIINNNSSSINILNDNHKYIFNNYKISPLIALLIYEKSINKLFDFIKRRMPKNNFIEIKKKYISFVVEKLHIKSKNILLNISEQDLINSNVKLFTSNINNTNNFFAQYSKLNLNSNSLYKCNCNSNSLFQLNKNKSQKSKLLSFNSFNNNPESKKNKSLINSSNILIQPKKPKNICHTEYNHKNNATQKLKKNKKIEIDNIENYNKIFKKIIKIESNLKNKDENEIKIKNILKLNLIILINVLKNENDYLQEAEDLILIIEKKFDKDWMKVYTDLVLNLLKKTNSVLDEFILNEYKKMSKFIGKEGIEVLIEFLKDRKIYKDKNKYEDDAETVEEEEENEKMEIENE